MGHYPIKCIHCMREIRMDAREIKLVPENFITSGDAVMESTESFDSVETADVFDDSFDFDSFEAADFSDNKRAMRLYESISELRAEGKITRENRLQIDISNEFWDRSEMYHEDLIQSLEVDDVMVDGKSLSGTVKKFYCPHCHSELIPLAGQLPIYLVNIMGPSSAGKTVYLTILHMLLNGKKYNLPQGSLTFEYLGGKGAEIKKFSSDLRFSNQLPGTTAEYKKDPYMMKVSYKVFPNSQETNKECILGLIDMRGELLSGQNNHNLDKYSVPQFKDSDGFIMMVDPETLERVYMSLPEQVFGGRNIRALDETLDAMKETIMECITSSMGLIKKPSIIALAKEDILYRYHQQLGIPINQPVIAPAFRMIPGTHYGRDYYGPLHQSTRQCIEYLSSAFTSFLDATFDKPYFLSLSALGSYVQISNGRVDNFAHIRPVRVEEPLLRLLMAFHFMPQFYTSAFVEDTPGTVQKWSTDYAQRKINVEQPKSEEPVKKGLFRRK